MSLVRVPYRNWFYPYSSGDSGTNFDYGGQATLDADGEAIALVFTAPRTGGIKYVTTRVSAPTTGGDLEATLETIDSAAAPTGTLYDANCTAVTHNITAAGNVTTTFTNACAVAAGDFLCYVLRRPTGSTFAGIVFRYGEQSYLTKQNVGFPLYNVYTTGAWVRTATIATYITIEYEDGFLFSPGTPVYVSYANITPNSGSTYNKRGVRMELPDCEVDGLVGFADWDGDAKVALYDNEGRILRESQTFTTAGRINAYRTTAYFTVEPIRLPRGVYYAMVVPTTTTGVGCLEVTFFDRGSVGLDWFYPGMRAAYGTTFPFLLQAANVIPTCAGVSIAALYLDSAAPRTRTVR